MMYPEAARAKEHGVEDYEGHPDIVGVPVHVQVKARSRSTVGSMWDAADVVRRKRDTGYSTHLVVQDAKRPPLLVVKLEDYVKEVLACPRCGTEKDGRLMGGQVVEKGGE